MKNVDDDLSDLEKEQEITTMEMGVDTKGLIVTQD
jgi:hypothetical protein